MDRSVENTARKDIDVFCLGRTKLTGVPVCYLLRRRLAHSLEAIYRLNPVADHAGIIFGIDFSLVSEVTIKHLSLHGDEASAEEFSKLLMLVQW